MFDAPMTAPVASRMGDTVSDTSTSVPSFRKRMVSKGSTRSARLIRAKFHLVRFCQSKASLCRAVADFFSRPRCVASC